MNNRRIRKLPTRPGKAPDASPIDGGSLEIVDLASTYRIQEDRKERELLARKERLEALRNARRTAEAETAAKKLGAQELESVALDPDGVAEAVELYEVRQRKHRVFTTPVQEEISSLNSQRIRWFERGGRLAAVGTVLLFVVLLGVYVSRSDRNSRDFDATGPDDPIDEVSLAMNIAQNVSDSNQVARKFLLAESMGERLVYVRYPKKVAKLMLKDKSMNWDAPLPLGELQSIGEPSIVEQMIIGSYVEDEQFKKYPLFVEIRQEGYLVDWEAFAEYNDVGWEVLMEERSSQHDYPLRVVARLDDYYNYQFTAEEYTCCHIGSRDGKFGMYAYARKRGWVEEELREYLRDKIVEQGPFSGLRNFLQIKIRFHDEPTPRPMAEITSFLAPHWFTLPPEQDEMDMVDPRAIIGDDREADVPANIEEIDWRSNRNRSWRTPQ